MSEERYDLFRLYLVNMEQHKVMKRTLALSLILLGVIATVYAAAIADFSGLWMVFFLILLVYFVFGDLIVGVMVFNSPKRIIKWAASQKFKEPGRTDTGELAATAAKLLRNGNLTVSKELLDQIFRLKNVGPARLIFASTVLADLQRTEGKLDSSLKTLKNNVLRKRKNINAYSMLVLGRTLIQQGNYQKAIEALEDADSCQKQGYYGVPNLFKSRFKNGELTNTYRDTLQVFIPFYLGKAYRWAPEGQQVAAQHLNSAVVLCRNRHLRPLLKKDFEEQE